MTKSEPVEGAEPIYCDGAMYDLINAQLIEDRDFFVERALAVGGPVLELACGSGRISIPIAERGIEIEGLDISEGMLREARRKTPHDLNLHWHLGNACAFKLPRQFRLIFIAFNSLLHIHRREDLEGFFKCVREHLARDGQLMIDIFNPSVQILARKPKQIYPVMELHHPENGELISIDEEAQYNSETQVNHVLWHFHFTGSGQVRTEELNMRCYFPQEMDALIYYNGFEVIEKMGGYDGKPFRSQSQKQIYVLRPRAHKQN